MPAPENMVAVAGLGVSSLMYGVFFGQLVYYLRGFPRDMTMIKMLVIGTTLLNTLHVILSSLVQSTILVSNHRSDSPWTMGGWLPVSMTISTVLMTLVVQAFYSHRVWIVSGKKPLLAPLITAMAVVQGVLGLGESNVLRTFAPRKYLEIYSRIAFHNG
ncbi:hypothetical protein HYDPIDRAFT_105980 [Hydnomerulius pinastri MD-312]|nr:hypothetical protein HYDPIDRAFT_105980 [Hydnomerulius pinastri MD-312]